MIGGKFLKCLVYALWDFPKSNLPVLASWCVFWKIQAFVSVFYRASSY